MTATDAPADWAWLLAEDLTEDEFSILVLSLSGEDREALAEELSGLRPPHAPWVPQAYQTPPPLSEPWQGWLLLAARSVGKTAAVTHWLNDHMTGPPCMPGPVPHRAGMFAPTLGDVSASLVNGADGLAIINPSVREMTIKGGTIVRWPNGAIAYEFGVNSKKDVDRCRPRTNRCLSAGTLIWTERGQVPIEQVTTADRVWTRQGLRRVLASTFAGFKPCIALTAEDGRTIRLTPDHRVWAGQEWEEAGSVDRIGVCPDLAPDPASSSTVRSSTGARTVTTTGAWEARPFFIEPSTSTTTGRYQSGTTSTTSTTTKRTTTRKISRSSHPSSTGMSMATTVPLIGIHWEDTPRHSIGPQPPWNARSAGPPSSHARLSRGSTAHLSVPRKATTEWRVSPRSATYAVRSSSPASTGRRRPELALLTVEHSSPTGPAEAVFDLTVEGEPEFFANGILVHNCCDAYEEIAAWPQLKYGMEQASLGLRAGIARWVGATTPRPRPTIKRLDTDPTVIKSRASIRDNIHLSEQRRQQFYDAYGGTHLELQELEGKIIDAREGALWSQDIIDAYRVGPADVPELSIVNVYVDPSWGTTGDECGIVVAGLGVDKDIYVLADLSRKGSPTEWGYVAALGYLPPPGAVLADLEPREYYGKKPRYICYEANFQGQQVKDVMRLVSRDLRRRLMYRAVHGKVSKRLRAEPALLLFEKGRVHMVNPDGRTFALLEHEMTTWVPPKPGADQGDPGDPPPPLEGQEENETPNGSDWSPNRLDSVTYACLDLALSGTGMRQPTEAARNAVRFAPVESASPTIPTRFAIPQRTSP